MKILTICLLACGCVTFFSGCASSEEGSSGGYSASQIAAQHADYDPTPHTYGNRY